MLPTGSGGLAIHFAKDRIPEKVELGELTVALGRYPAGLDVDSLLRGLPNNMCPCPHWGYVLEGRLRVRYGDGSREEVRQGDVYYLPAPHTAEVLEDFSCVEFSPKKEFWEVMAHIAKRMEGA